MERRSSISGRCPVRESQPGYGLARVCDYGVVNIEGEDDTTARLIRKKYATGGQPIRLPCPSGISKSHLNNIPQCDTDVIPNIWYDEFELEEYERRRLSGRTHSRLLLRSFG
jgi:hypothetical protein